MTSPAAPPGPPSPTPAHPTPARGGPYAYRGEPAGVSRPRGARTSAVLAVVAAVLLVLGLGAVAVWKLVGGAVRAVFGTCEHTPAVVADIAAGELDVRSVSYDCHRGPAAEVTADTAEVYVSLPAPVSSTDELLAYVTGAMQRDGWHTSSAPGTLAQDGYTVEVVPHSLDPAMVLLDISRDMSARTTGWDRSSESYPAEDFTADDRRTFAVLPDYLPTVAPAGYEPWSEGYDLFREYGASSHGPHGENAQLDVVHQSLEPVDPEPCGEPRACRQVGTGANGLAIYEVVHDPWGDKGGGPARFGDGTYHARIGEANLYVHQLSLEQDEVAAGARELTVEDVVAVLGSVDVDAVAPAVPAQW